MCNFITKGKLIIMIISLFCCKISFSQNQKPIAVRDTASTLTEMPVTVHVLLNDYDPEGDSIKVSTATGAKHGKISGKTDTTVKYTSYYYTGLDSVLYTIKDKAGNSSDPAYIVINVLNNPTLPFANNDSAFTISCDSVILYVTQNDNDPNGDKLEIDPSYLNARHDQVLTKINDTVLLYRSFPSFIGTDTINYRVRKKNNPLLYSNNAIAIIHVGSNSGIPVAVNDIINYPSFSQKHINPVQNDFIPTQDTMELVFPSGAPSFATLNNDLTLDYYDSTWNNNDLITIPYFIRRKHDPAYYSNTAGILIQYVHNPLFFYANTDTLTTAPYQVLIHDLLLNDYNPNTSIPLTILTCTHGMLSDSTRFTDHLLKYYPNKLFGGMDTVRYTISEVPATGKKSAGKVIITVKNKSEEYLDINNIRARFTASGLHFFNKYNADFEVPKGSGKTSVFANSIWIGGKDGSDSLHFAGEKYRQGPYTAASWTCPDYYAGPVMNSSAYGYKQDSTWSYIWKLNRTEIEYHRNHFGDEGYQPMQDILTWPGDGNVNLGQSAKLAPFVDLNADGIYNPYDGDYPEIRGDQALFFIFNDDRDIHHESQGKKLKVEIQGLAYAFNIPEDTAFKNTIFLHYTVINLSPETYKETYFGIFTDIDLGYAYDDFIGCDVERNMYFGYNGNPIDGSGQTYAYGAHPPVQSVTLLAGPKMDDDGIDNPKYDNQGNQLCDESVNGLFFGDSIVDNERFGMWKFVYFNNSNSGVPLYMQDPRYAPEYYDMMRGIWKDGTQMIYGGNGHVGAGGYGPECDFMFPGDSDSLNWGVGCAPPNGPVYWTEKTAQNNPSDRRGLSSSGPITFKPGDKQDIDIAFSWARDYESMNPIASLIKLQNVVDKINLAFAENKLPNGLPIYGITEHPSDDNLKFKIYPNPAKDFINIEFDRNQYEPTTIKINSLNGELIQEIHINCQKIVNVNVRNLSNGIYIIQCQSKSYVGTKKLILLR